MIDLQNIVNSKNDENVFSKLLKSKLGVFSIPLYIVIAIIVYLACVYNKLPNDMIGGFAVLMTMGIFLGAIGSKLPVLKNIGGPAIFTIFIPSAMVYYKLINPSAIKAMTTLMKSSNFLYLYISCLITGSILGMNRKVMIKGFIRMFVPLIVGTIGSILFGLLIAVIFGFKAEKAFFYVICPILSGGLGEGVLPLSMGYADVLHESQSAFIAQLVPAAMIGNVVAIIISGILKHLAEKKPHLTGNGLLVKTGDDKEILEAMNTEKTVDFNLMGGGLLVACTFFVFGALASKFIGIPGPVIMIFMAAIVKYLKLLPKEIETGAYHMYSFTSKSLTWPLLVGVGVVYTPWKDVVAVVSPIYILICAAAVIAMVASGFFIGKLLNMYPIESALVTACHSGLGGTGDVAILSSANRIELMPFSQISTRLGGATMVVIATMLLKMLS
ncbi:2-hydroxycarboxylate transporter family protein [Clostridium autoethanogenum]|uniref:2-hydroxycarboxylate transporter family protein n=1 Tax=Clostridium autoethanogenum TaxID=84023 RepID=UPI0014300C98